MVFLFKIKMIRLLCLIFIAGQINAQIVTVRKYVASDGFCANIIFIINDTTYVFEGGCEGNLYSSYGKCVIQDDTLSFAPFDRKEIQCPQIIYASDSIWDTMHIKIIDPFGLNASKYYKLLTINRNKSKAQMLIFDPLNNDLTGINYYGGEMIFYTLNAYLKYNFSYEIEGENKYVIKTEIPIFCINSNSTYWSDFGEFQLINNNNKLISFSPQFINQTYFQLKSITVYENGIEKKKTRYDDLGVEIK